MKEDQKKLILSGHLSMEGSTATLSCQHSKTLDLDIDNFTVSLRLGGEHGYFILPLLIIETSRIDLNKKKNSIQHKDWMFQTYRRNLWKTPLFSVN